MEPGFHGFQAGRTVVTWPVVESDSASSWDGSYYVVPEDGLYDLTMAVWVENVSKTPQLVGAQLWNDEGVIAWDSEHITTPFQDSLAASLLVVRKAHLRAGERIHVEFFVLDAESALSGYSHESWLSIVKLR